MGSIFDTGDKLAGVKTGAVASAQEQIDAFMRDSAMNIGAQPQEGRKYDTSKPRMAQLLSDFALALEAVATVGEMGAQKYDLHNWPLVKGGVLRYEDAQMRHQIMRWQGEAYDPESDLLHRAHEAWNALAHLQLALSHADGMPLRRMVVKSEGTY